MAEDFERALQPAGYVGARRRLREFLLSLVRGEAVEVAVLGGSMTYGKGAEAAWPQLFEAHMRSLGHSITVHNLAKPMTGSEFAVNNIVHLSPELDRADLVIIDTSINDQRDWFRDASSPEGTTAYDLLVQQLLEMHRRPAVIDFAPLHFSDTSFQIFNQTVSCSANLSHFTHARAEAFQLPILSFPDAMCKCCGHNGLWFGNQHPNTTTHDAIARTLVGALGVEIARACEPGGLDVPDHPALAGSLRATPFDQCWRQQRTSVDFTAFSSPEEGAPFVEEHGGWTFARDLPSKPFGWMTAPGSPEGQVISFKVNASVSGWIRLDYLSTYESSGREAVGGAACWVDGVDRRQCCSIAARLIGDFSIVRSAYIGLPSGLGAERLLCRSSGGKFKVLGLASC